MRQSGMGWGRMAGHGMGSDGMAGHGTVAIHDSTGDPA